MVTLAIDFETTDEHGNPVVPDFAEIVATLHQPSEFFKALYWKFEGRMIRLTTYDERNLADAEQTEIAFRRARDWKLNPLYMRVFAGSFLRYGPDDCTIDDGILNPDAGGPVAVWCHV